jgi:hypothetical protein
MGKIAETRAKLSMLAKAVGQRGVDAAAGGVEKFAARGTINPTAKTAVGRFAQTQASEFGHAATRYAYQSALMGASSAALAGTAAAFPPAAPIAGPAALGTGVASMVGAAHVRDLKMGAQRARVQGAGLDDMIQRARGTNIGAGMPRAPAAHAPEGAPSASDYENGGGKAAGFNKANAEFNDAHNGHMNGTGQDDGGPSGGMQRGWANPHTQAAAQAALGHNYSADGTE